MNRVKIFMKPLIYIASPHSHSDPYVRDRRYQLVKRAWVMWFKLGYCAFSPILHANEAAKEYNLDRVNFEFYRELDERLIKASDEVWVLCIDGWRESRGVQSEIKFAKQIGKPVFYYYYDNDETLDSLVLGID